MTLRSRFACILMLAVLVSFALPAQAQFTTVTATNIQRGDGLPLALGTMCWLGTSNAGQPIGYRAGTSGQTITSPVCRDIINGAVQTTYKGTTIGVLKVADTTVTQPANVCYKVSVVDSATGKVVLGSFAGTTSGYDCVQPSGTTWSFDLYTPAGTPNVVQVAGPQGLTGATGATGPQGPAGTVGVGTVTTGAAGTSASVTNSGTPSAATLNFTIPKGDKGDTGNISSSSGTLQNTTGLLNLVDASGNYTQSFVANGYRFGNATTANRGTITSSADGQIYFTPSVSDGSVDPRFSLFRITGTNQEYLTAGFVGTLARLFTGAAGTGVKRNLEIAASNITLTPDTGNTITLAGATALNGAVTLGGQLNLGTNTTVKSSGTFTLIDGSGNFNTAVGAHAYRLSSGANSNWGTFDVLSDGQVYWHSSVTDGTGADPKFMVYRLLGANQEYAGITFDGTANHDMAFGTFKVGTGVARNIRAVGGNWTFQNPLVTMPNGAFCNTTSCTGFVTPGGALGTGDGSTLNQAASGITLLTFGDSITAGTGTTGQSKQYGTIVATKMGWTRVSRAVGGDGINRQAYVMYTSDPVSQGDYFSLMIGQNVIGKFTTDSERTYRVLLGAIAYRLIPDTISGTVNQSKYTTQSTSVTKTGTWTNSDLFTTIGMKATTANATATASLPGNTIFLGFTASTTTDYTACVSVDSVQKGCWSPTTWTETNAATGITQAWGPWGVVLPLYSSAGTTQHTVTVTCTTPGTSGCYLDWIGSNGGITKNVGPHGWLLTPFPWVSANYPAVTNGGAVYRRLVRQLARAGLSVDLVDTAGYVDMTADPALVDGGTSHPNDAANARLADAFFSEVEPLVVPRDRAETRAAWSTPVSTFSGFIRAFANSALTVSYFQPTDSVVLTRIMAYAATGFYTGCSTAPALTVSDGTSTVTVPLAATNKTDSGVLYQQFAPNSLLTLSVTSGIGCTLSGSNPDINVTVQYQQN